MLVINSKYINVYILILILNLSQELSGLDDDNQNDANSSNTARGLMGLSADASLALDRLKERFFKDIRGKDKVESIARTFCARARWESEDVCASVAKTFRDEVVKVLAYALFTPNQICGLLSNNVCGHFNDPFGDWNISLEASEHLDVGMPYHNDINEKDHQLDLSNREQTSPYKVIHISDIHVDLNYVAGSWSDCEEPLCCQATSTLSTGLVNRIEHAMESDIAFQKTINFNKADADGKAGYWGSYSHCDLPVRTMEQFLMKLNETITNDNSIDYIIWTGDIQPHDIWKQDKHSAKRNYETVFSMINQYLPNVKIFPTLGNHEMVPVDSFSPSNLWNIAKDDSPSWLYTEMNQFWSKWLPPTTDTTILKDGNYAATARPGLKIISLNTNYCNDKNFWLFINATDPGNQLQWLVHELQISELLKEKVHIIGHIPPGAEDCLRVWSKNFNRIIRRYKKTVTSQFYGHTHNNEFQIFYDIRKVEDRLTEQRPETDRENSSLPTSSVNGIGLNQDVLNSIDRPLVAKSEPTDQEKLEAAKIEGVEPISVGFIGPSATTFVGLNPSFRIYTVNPLQGFLPIDFDTYYLNLTAANQIAKNRWNITDVDIPDGENDSLNSTTLEESFLGNNSTTDEKREREKNVTMRSMDEPEKLDWVYGGSFAQTFNIPDVSPYSLHRLITNMGKGIGKKGRIPESLKSLITRLFLEEDQENYIKGESEKLSQHSDDIYKLYRLFYSFSDLFGPERYAKCDDQCRKLFLCRYLTGESHNPSFCIKYIRKSSPSRSL